MAKKLTKTITIFEGQTYSLPSKLIDFQAFINEQINKIPQENLSSSVVSFDYSSDSWESYNIISIHYEREETDEEYKNRTEQEKNRIKRAKELKEMEERRQYERLKKKYQKDGKTEKEGE